jgi:two-component system LytT family response regulator
MPMQIKVLIVDDEPLARKGVALRLKAHTDIEIVGMCSNGQQAVQRITELAPDLVFLDIQMPLMSGFEVIRALPPERQPTVIFLTAFDEHALAAFDVEALDYLLKPIDEARFLTAVERARRLIALKRQNATDGGMKAMPDAVSDATTMSPIKRFTVRVGRDVAFVEVDTIDWIEATGDYAQLHVGPRTYLLRQPLNTLETMLDRNDFFRVHRSTIIRLDRIVRISALANRDGSLTLRNGITLRVSRSYSKPLRDRLRNRN